jgi:hypothetical protein
MASTEGAAIPRIYGRARLSGQVIWATNLEEVAITHIRNYIRPLIVAKEQSPTSAPSPLFPRTQTCTYAIAVSA